MLTIIVSERGKAMAAYTYPFGQGYIVPIEKAKAFMEEKADPAVLEKHRKRCNLKLSTCKIEDESKRSK